MIVNLKKAILERFQGEATANFVCACGTIKLLESLVHFGVGDVMVTTHTHVSIVILRIWFNL